MTTHGLPSANHNRSVARGDEAGAGHPPGRVPKTQHALSSSEVAAQTTVPMAVKSAPCVLR
jgi:hypothetical protein